MMWCNFSLKFWLKKGETIYELDYRPRSWSLIWIEYFTRSRLKFPVSNVPSYSYTFVFLIFPYSDTFNSKQTHTTHQNKTKPLKLKKKKSPNREDFTPKDVSEWWWPFSQFLFWIQFSDFLNATLFSSLKSFVTSFIQSWTKVLVSF